MFTLFARVSGFQMPLPRNVVSLTQHPEPEVLMLGYKNEIDQGVGVPLQVQLKTLQGAVSETDRVYGFGITSIADWNGDPPSGSSHLAQTVRAVEDCDINVTLHRPFEHGIWVWFSPQGGDPDKAFFAYGSTLCTWFTSHVSRTEIVFRKMYEVFERNNELAELFRDKGELAQEPFKTPTLALARSVSGYMQGLLDDLRQSPELLGSPKVRSAAS